MDALNYSEKKVQKGKAACIAANGYLLAPEKMNFYQKLAGFENRNKRNDRATTKTLHVSLNFDPAEKLPDEKLTAIAESYMQKIGFGDQPYLVYRHDDAGHPHIHIVSTTIKADGKRINTHGLGRNQSTVAREAIEKDFQLVKAQRGQQALTSLIKPLDTAKVLYGKSETKRGITSVLATVFNHYNYTSLAEYNAALKQYNIMADRGEEDGTMYKKRGLLYRVLNEEGIPVGVPIKASDIYLKPTLDNLEKNFERNKGSRQPLRQKLKATLDAALQERPSSIQKLSAMLLSRYVFTVIRQNDEGRLYGITFVDNQNKSVFNGSDVGRQYSIGNLVSVLSLNDISPIPAPEPTLLGTPVKIAGGKLLQKRVLTAEPLIPKGTSLLEELMSPKQQMDSVPFQLIKKKKKRKKKNDL